MIRCKILLPLVLLAGISVGATAQSSVRESFLSEAREASARYHDLNNAIADGYRQVGPEFPGMGEHWVHLTRIINRNVRADQPSVLSYFRVDGEPILGGVAYGIPNLKGESPPDLGLGDIWHAHSGTVDEETLVLNPMSSHGSGHSNAGLAMFHAWIWTDNPAGVFEQDNWALPFLRAGLAVPETITPAAGKAFFLLGGGVSYYMGLFGKATSGILPRREEIR